MPLVEANTAEAKAIKAEKRRARRQKVRVGNRIVKAGRARSELLAQEVNFDDWDDEEILRGRRRDKNGGWSGRPPLVVPTRVHEEVTRRKIRAAEAVLKDSLEEAVQMLRELMNGKDVEDSVKLRASQLIIERVMGKTPERIEVHATETPFQTTLAAIHTDRSRVLDADSWEEGEDGEAEGQAS